MENRDDGQREKDIRAEVEARLKEEAEALKDEKKDDEITPEFVQACLLANERGDGTLYAAIHRGKFTFNLSLGEWFFWKGHYWSIDEHAARARCAVDNVVRKYDEATEPIEEKINKAIEHENESLLKILKKEKEPYNKSIGRLQRISGANNCLNWAYCVEGGLSIREADFDRNPWVLAFTNGVVELKTGLFRPGRPDDYITKAVPHEWKGFDVPAEVWEKFLDEVFGGDKELIAYLQRVFGYGITGLSTEHVFLVLHGEGRNGKGTLVETLKYVLGDLAKPIQSELLLDQRNARSSSGPSSDIMALKGLRIAFASETDEHRRFSSSKVKWLSGGDTLTARPAHAPFETVWKPTHLLCLLTNYLPHASGDDYAFWQRVNLVHFKYKFVDEPRAENERKKIKDLPEKLEAEASGILAWLVRGCIEWQRQGLNPPLAVRSATERYRISEDLIAGFLAARCDSLEDSVNEKALYKDLYNAFKDWYTSAIGDEKYCPKKQKFSQAMEKRFTKSADSGLIYFHGVSLKPDYLIGE